MTLGAGCGPAVLADAEGSEESRSRQVGPVAAEVDRGHGPARLGRVLGNCSAVCVVTGMLSHNQYHVVAA